MEDSDSSEDTATRIRKAMAKKKEEEVLGRVGLVGFRTKGKTCWPIFLLVIFKNVWFWYSSSLDRYNVHSNEIPFLTIFY